jgi:hypothetical protein
LKRIIANDQNVERLLKSHVQNTGVGQMGKTIKKRMAGKRSSQDAEIFWQDDCGMMI